MQYICKLFVLRIDTWSSNKVLRIMSLLTSLHDLDATQGQFKAEFNRFKSRAITT